MKPATFEYIRPETTRGALDALASHGDEARVLAGGQSLVPMMNLRLARPAVLVDITHVQELRELRVCADAVTIGAGVRQLAVERSADVAAALPILRQGLAYVGHAPIRSRGTVCGSVAHADPLAELPAVVLALDAVMVAAGPTGRREIAAADFFWSYYTTALEPDELLAEIRIPRPAERWGSAFLEVARRHGDFALAGVATLVDVDDDRRIRGVRLALSGVAEVPVRAVEAEGALSGVSLDDGQALRAAADAAIRTIDPMSDVHATSEFRREVAGVLVRRAVALAGERSIERGGSLR
ncbi:MAG: xanthine dehydrogenase family protein subunit M [Solirubrobacteraceae bacterium]|nr:xanthine dehydrogenase family protein subunit M [Solirubrobacteraceae bacterium]